MLSTTEIMLVLHTVLVWLKNGTIYNRNNPSSSYKVGTIRDAEKVISGRCSDSELGAIYILMKAGKL